MAGFASIPMDSLIGAAARALAAGDALGALNCVALRDDAHALALRGIAMAQLGDFDREAAASQRGACVRAEACPGARPVHRREAEVALAAREMPDGVVVAGLESDGGDRFFCGGGSSGKVRVVRRPQRNDGQ